MSEPALVRYHVTVYTEAHATAEVVAPADATEAQLREAVLRMCDTGEASFEADYGVTEAYELPAATLTP